MKNIFGQLLFLAFVIAGGTTAYGQPADEKAIRKLMNDQVAAWNSGSLENFMHGYWHSDSLTFVSGSGVTYGYKNALDHYRKKYSDTAKMGKLFFTLIQVKPLSPNYFYVTGRYFLKRTIGDAQGYFTLLFRKINGEWVIISDHTSG